MTVIPCEHWMQYGAESYSALLVYHYLNAYVRVIRSGQIVSKEYSAEDLNWIENVKPLSFSSDITFRHSEKQNTWFYKDIETNKVVRQTHNRNELTFHRLDRFENMFCTSGNVICIYHNGLVKQGNCRSFDVSFNIFSA